MLICPECGAETREAEGGARCAEDGAILLTPEALELWGEDPFIGRLIAGRYVVFGLLGRGGFSTVYRALQEPLGREIALKTIQLDEREDAENHKRRFFQEAKILAKLTHPGIVRVFDYGEDEGDPAAPSDKSRLFMALEMIQGEPLSAHLKAGPLPTSRAVDLCVQILEALVEPHRHHLVHRDLKPSNILLAEGYDSDAHIKLIDFGIAKALVKEKAQPKTRMGVIIGTVNYMAPEQLRGRGEIGPWSDQYAVGVLLYQMLSGEIPFTGSDPEIASGHLSVEPPPFPSRLQVPVKLERAVMKALSKQHEDRFKCVSDMAEMLKGSLDGNLVIVDEGLATKKTEDAGHSPQDQPTSESYFNIKTEIITKVNIVLPDRIKKLGRNQKIFLALAVVLIFIGSFVVFADNQDKSEDPKIEKIKTFVIINNKSANKKKISKLIQAKEDQFNHQTPIKTKNRVIKKSNQLKAQKKEKLFLRDGQIDIKLKTARGYWKANQNKKALNSFTKAKLLMKSDHAEWSSTKDRIEMLRDEIKIEHMISMAEDYWKRGNIKKALELYKSVGSMISSLHPEWSNIKDRISILREEIEQ